MNFGYLIFASNNENTDYIKLAYALAMSIKDTQKHGWDKVAIATDNSELINQLKSPWVFDKVIEWNKGDFWDCRSYMYDVSPWEYTICLDSDMLFTRDISHVVESLVEEHSIYLPNNTYTYKGNMVTDDYYRKTFTKNNLPNVYTLFSFFSRTDDNKKFFNLVKVITEYQKEFKNSYLTEYTPTVLGTDEIFALASKILDYPVTLPVNLVRVLHMKGQLQNWHAPSEQVSDKIGFYLGDNCNLKIGTFWQNDIVHYVEKDLMTEERISILEYRLWKKIK